MPEAHDIRGFVQLRRGEPAQALGDYQAALALRPAMVSALFGRGLAEKRLGDIARADADLARAATLDPQVAGDFARYGLTP
jgi:Flp pilus assembly protein TadD